jgi:hypothetical protein
MASNAYRYVTGSIFAIVALAHLIRALRAVPVQIGNSPFPIWLSWILVFVAGALSVWAFRGRGSA